MAFPRFSCIIPVRYKANRKSLKGSSQAIQCNAVFGGEKPILSTTISENNSRKSFKKQLMATVNVVCRLGRSKKLAFFSLTWDGVRSRSNGRGYFAE